MATCAQCGATISEDGAVALSGGPGAASVPLCPTCASVMEIGLSLRTETPNLAGALLFGLVAALVSSLLWYGIVVVANYELGLIAVLVGWLIGQATLRGAGGVRARSLQLLSGAITLVAMAFSQYLIVHHLVAEMLAEDGAELPLLLPAEEVLELIRLSLSADPLTLLFWAIAVYEAVTIPGLRKVVAAQPN